MGLRDQWRRVPVPSGVERTLDAVLDRALDVQRPAVLAYLERARTRRPHAAPDDVVRRLERRYLATVVGIGGASGAAAAAPGAGTAASVATGAAEITAFVNATALYVLALAELHGLPVSDPQLRRALVVAVLVGEGGETLLEAGEVGTSHWAQVLAGAAGKGKTASGKAGVINARVRTMLLTRFGARQGVLLLGRALPLGIGAGIGAAGNLALARTAIASARRAFGPAPAAFPPRVVDVRPRRPRPGPGRRRG